MMQEEQWKDIDEFPGYQISNHGIVKSLSRIKKMPYGKFMILPEVIMSSKKVKLYNCVKLCKDGKHYSRRICRLVGMYFVPNPLRKPFINHLDCNKGNDYFENLEWSTGSENMKHAYANGLLKMPWAQYRNHR